MTEQELQGIEARAAAATPEPWTVRKCSYVTKGDACGIDPMGQFDYSYDECHHPLVESDAEFIAAARTDVPALAAEVRRLRKIVDRAQKVAFLCSDGSGNHWIERILGGEDVPPQWFDSPMIE